MRTVRVRARAARVGVEVGRRGGLVACLEAVVAGEGAGLVEDARCRRRPRSGRARARRRARVSERVFVSLRRIRSLSRSGHEARGRAARRPRRSRRSGGRPDACRARGGPRRCGKLKGGAATGEGIAPPDGLSLLHVSEGTPAPGIARAAGKIRCNPTAASGFVRPMRTSQIVPLVVATALFMENTDSTVIATALPTIADSLGDDPIALKLALTAYLVSLAIFIPDQRLDGRPLRRAHDLPARARGVHGGLPRLRLLAAACRASSPRASFRAWAAP